MELLSSIEPGPAPELGVVSQTIATSSVVKWILPARIRSPAKNDVVFVGETSIQLREFVTSGSMHLSEVTGRLDFQTSILEAKVLSAKLEAIPILEAIKHQTGASERFTFGGQPIAEDHPAQILVLSTSTSHLVFVYAKQCYNGDTRFVYAKRHIMGDYFPATRLCRHLAVDPESRALAAAPSIGHFSLLSMRSITEIKQQIDGWRPSNPSSFRPWHEQRMAQVDGFIVKMDFLYTPNDDPDKVILTLVVANEGQLFLLLYRWDTRTPLHKFKPMRCSGQLLSPSDGFPLMLIPLRSSLSFLLVTEQCFIVYDHVTASQASTTRYTFNASDAPQSNGVGQSSKKFTQWARPYRHLLYRGTRDDIILVREDGLIEVCMIEFANRKVQITTQHRPGGLGCNVDSAFCLLEGPSSHDGGEIIIAGGDMHDGGLFQAKARVPIERIQILPNAAPFQDLVLVDSSEKQIPAESKSITSAHLFACCGHVDGRSSVAQLHYGYEARIGDFVEYPDSPSIERMFTIEIRSAKRLLLIISHASHTTILATTLGDIDLEAKDSNTLPSFEHDQTTLAATMINDKILQATPSSLNVVHEDDIHGGLRFDWQHFQPVCAEIVTELKAVALGHVHGDSFAISVLDLTQLPDNASELLNFQHLVSISSRPLCVKAAVLGDVHLLLVGTEGGDIHMLRLLAQNGPAPLFHGNVRTLVPGLDGIAVTSLCILSHATLESGVLLCGLRGGKLLCLDITIESGSRSFDSGTLVMSSLRTSSADYRQVFAFPACTTWETQPPQ
jgi:hypothetical protein